jgi:crotonobetainyl-CoA:carnitine CoA-transferase CaiB-like acyl-CoA transferase
MAAPLDDVRIIEIDSWMAAPSAGAVLADLGADVIKIEPLGGDPMRDLGRPPKIEGDAKGYDYQFDVDNRGKRSIAVDLGSAAGQAVVHRLIEGADVFMCNLLAQRQERFGLDPATVGAIRPGIVHATLTGYGTSGPEAWRPGYDVTAFFGRSGLYDALREGDDGEVPMARPAQGDHTTGLALVGAVLAALRLAERTGETQVVETSLYETAVWTQASDFAVTAVDRAPVRRRARNEMILPTANRYPCGDGKWIVMNMPEAAAWDKLCRIIGREEVPGPPDQGRVGGDLRRRGDDLGSRHGPPRGRPGSPGRGDRAVSRHRRTPRLLPQCGYPHAIRHRRGRSRWTRAPPGGTHGPDPPGSRFHRRRSR